MEYLKIGGIAVCLLIAWKIGGMLYDAGQESVQVKWEQAKVAHANALIKQASEYRTREQQWATAVTSVSDWHTKERGRLRNDYESTIAGINDGTFILRERFRGCQQQLSETPGAAPTPADSDGGSDGGLSTADQGFLVRIGQQCDDIATRLSGLQRYVRSIQ